MILITLEAIFGHSHSSVAKKRRSWIYAFWPLKWGKMPYLADLLKIPQKNLHLNFNARRASLDVCHISKV